MLEEKNLPAREKQKAALNSIYLLLGNICSLCSALLENSAKFLQSQNRNVEVMIYPPKIA
jgi:hypothetical protein